MLNINASSAQILNLKSTTKNKKTCLFLKKLNKELVAEHLNRRAMQKMGIPFLLQQTQKFTLPVIESNELESKTSFNKRKQYMPQNSIP